jgi:hypothetical protein
MCHVPEYYRIPTARGSTLGPILTSQRLTAEQLPAWAQPLTQSSFTVKEQPNITAYTTPTVMIDSTAMPSQAQALRCYSQPGPALPELHCVKTGECMYGVCTKYIAWRSHAAMNAAWLLPTSSASPHACTHFLLPHFLPCLRVFAASHSSVVLCCPSPVLPTEAGSWLAYRWYRFVDQPALQSLGLTDAQKAFLQARITALHRMLAPEAPLNRWLRAPAGTPALAGIDPALLTSPPAGFEAGYVPITLFEGLSKPGQCS